MSRIPHYFGLSSPAQGEAGSWGLQGLLLCGDGGMGSGHSPVSAASSVPITSGEERLIYTLHKGLQDGQGRASGNSHGTHSAAIGDGGNRGTRARTLQAQICGSMRHGGFPMLL